MRRRDTIVLLLICGFVLLNAGALRMGGGMRAKLLICTTNMKKLGEALPIYCDCYDGRMPYPASHVVGGISFIKTPYEVCLDHDHAKETDNIWMNLGCLYKTQLIGSGRQLCCPANTAGFSEYEAYCTGIGAGGEMIVAPWGTIPNWPTIQSTWWHVEVRKGYAFWPQAKHLLTQAEYNIIAGRGENPSVRYLVGFPATPGRLADMDPGRTFSCDYQAVFIKGSGFSIQAVFGDGHVNMQAVPVDPVDGKFWYPYQSSYPQGELASNWKEIIPTVRYFYALQP